MVDTVYIVMNILVIILLVAIVSNNPLVMVDQPPSWCYILQGFDPYYVDSYTGCNVLVIDYSRDGGNDTTYTREDINYIKSHDVEVYAYLSIGEAEDYRWYWNGSWYTNHPYWLLDENPEWPGNYLVIYWAPEWRDILRKYIDIIVNQGFDGLYLDKIDSYESLTVYGYDINHTTYEMYMLIKWIRDYIGSNMKIILQNGEDIVKYQGNITDLIDGWGIEDLFYNGPTPNNWNDISYRLETLTYLRGIGKEIFVVDYTYNGLENGQPSRNVIDFHVKCRMYGFTPYAAYADRDLDEIVIIKGIQPTTDIYYLLGLYIKHIFRM